MILQELIDALKKEDPEKVLAEGFSDPHSYRGYYDELAFEPAENVTVGAMLADAVGALGNTFPGYKGGDYVMSRYTECWLANYGCCGEQIGYMALKYMLSTAQKGSPEDAK